MKIRKLILIPLLLGSSFFAFNASAETIKLTCNKNTSSTTCLLCNCYHESRGESLNGKVAVAKTVLSRAKSDSFPDTICKVVYQAAQFSWTGDRISNNISATKPMDIDAYKECKSAVNTALQEGPNGLLYFYNPHKVSPAWARKKFPKKHKTKAGQFMLKTCRPDVDKHRFLVPSGKDCPKYIGANGKSAASKTDKKTKTEKGIQ